MVSRIQIGTQDPIRVKAAWDPDAEVWYTESSSLPGSIWKLRP